MPETWPTGIHVSVPSPNLTGSAGLIAGGWFDAPPWHGLGDAAAHAECGASIPRPDMPLIYRWQAENSFELQASSTAARSSLSLLAGSGRGTRGF